MPISDIELMRKYGAKPTIASNIKEILKAYGRGSAFVPETLANISEIVGDVFRVKRNPVEQFFREQTQKIVDFYQPSTAVSQAGWTERPFMRMATGVSSALPATLSSMLPAVRAARVLGVSKAGLIPAALFGVMSGGEQYHEARQRGLGVLPSLGIGAARGVGEAGLEYIPAETLLGTLLGERGLLGGLFKQMLAEGITEGAQRGWENVLRKTYQPNTPITQGILDEALVGAGMGGLLGGVGYVSSRLSPLQAYEPPIELSPDVAARLKAEDLVLEEQETPEVLALPKPQELEIKPATTQEMLDYVLRKQPEGRLTTDVIRPPIEMGKPEPEIIDERGKPTPLVKKIRMPLEEKLQVFIESAKRHPDKKFKLPVDKIVKTKEDLKKYIALLKEAQSLKNVEFAAKNKSKLRAIQALLKKEEAKPVTPKKQKPDEIQISQQTKVVSVKPPLYSKPTPRYVREVILPSGTKVLLEAIGEVTTPKTEVSFTEEELRPEVMREGYRKQVYDPLRLEKNISRQVELEVLAHEYKAGNVTRYELENRLANLGFAAESIPGIVKAIEEGEIEGLPPERAKYAYIGRTQNLYRAEPRVSYNVYTENGDLIFSGYGKTKDIKRLLTELDKSIQKGLDITELYKKAEEEVTGEKTIPRANEIIKQMLNADITTEEAIDRLIKEGYSQEQAEALTNAAWDKMAEIEPTLQAKSLKEYVKEATKKGETVERAIVKYINNIALRQGVPPEEYANKVILEALKLPNTRKQLAFIRSNLAPNFSLEDLRRIRKQKLLEIEKKMSLIKRDDDIETIKEKLKSIGIYLPQSELDEIARGIYEVKESIIPYDDPVALSQNLLEDVANRIAVNETIEGLQQAIGKGMAHLSRLLSDESGEIIISDQAGANWLSDSLKLLTTSATVLEHSGEDTAQLVDVARDIYENISVATALFSDSGNKYIMAVNSLSSRARKKIAQWLKENYDRTNYTRVEVRKKFNDWLRRNPSINKQKAREVLNRLIELNNAHNFLVSQIEELYGPNKTYKINIINTDAYKLKDGRVVSGAKYRHLLSTKNKKYIQEADPVVVAEIQTMTQQGIKRTKVVFKKEGDWMTALQEKAKAFAAKQLRPWRNYIPHYREVKEGDYWLIIKKGDETVWASVHKNKADALKQLNKVAKQKGWNLESDEFVINIKPHKNNPDFIPLDILPIEVEGWLARLDIDPDSDVGRKIIEAVKSRSGFYSHFIKSKNIEGWDDTLEGFLRGFTQAFNTATFVYQRLYAKNHMLPLLNKIEDNNSLSPVTKRIARAFVESYTKFEKLDWFTKTLMRTRAFVYVWALANKATYVIQNSLEWIYALPAIAEDVGISNAINIGTKILFPATGEVKRLMRRAQNQGLTSFRSWLKYEINPSVADKLIDTLSKTDILGTHTEELSSALVFRIGLEAAKIKGLSGDRAYRYARDFLLGRGKIFMTKGNKISAFLLINHPIAKVLYPLFMTVVADLLGKQVYRLKGNVSAAFFWMMLYILMAGVEGLPFVDKKKFSELRNPVEVVMRKGFLGLAGIDTGFLSLNPFIRTKIYITANPYKTAQSFVEAARNLFAVSSAWSMAEIANRALRFGEKYHLGPLVALYMLPLGGFQHMFKGFIEATLGPKAYNKYRKKYIDIGWRAGSLYELILESFGIPTAGKFDAWEQYKEEARRRHEMWVFKHPFEAMEQEGG